MSPDESIRKLFEKMPVPLVLQPQITNLSRVIAPFRNIAWKDIGSVRDIPSIEDYNEVIQFNTAVIKDQKNYTDSGVGFKFKLEKGIVKYQQLSPIIENRTDGYGTDFNSQWKTLVCDPLRDQIGSDNRYRELPMKKPLIISYTNKRGNGRSEKTFDDFDIKIQTEKQGDEQKSIKFDMIAADGNRIFVKEKDANRFYFTTMCDEFMHYHPDPEATSGHKNVPGFYIKLDPNFGSNNGKLGWWPDPKVSEYHDHASAWIFQFARNLRENSDFFVAVKKSIDDQFKINPNNSDHNLKIFSALFIYDFISFPNKSFLPFIFSQFNSETRQIAYNLRKVIANYNPNVLGILNWLLDDDLKIKIDTAQMNSVLKSWCASYCPTISGIFQVFLDICKKTNINIEGEKNTTSINLKTFLEDTSKAYFEYSKTYRKRTCGDPISLVIELNEFFDSIIKSKTHQDFQQIRVEPGIWHEIDNRPPINSKDPSSKYPLHEECKYKENFFGNIGLENTKKVISYDLVLSIGVGHEHRHNHYQGIYGGEFQAPPNSFLWSSLNDRAGFWDGTCNFYMLVRLKNEKPDSQKKKYTILWADEQSYFSSRWRSIDPNDSNWDKFNCNVLPFWYWSPFDENGFINDNSRMAVSNQVIVVTGKENNKHKIYTMNKSFGSSDLTWRWRNFPEGLFVLDDLIEDEFPTENNTINAKSVRIHPDMTIYFKGNKNGEEGYYYQKYLPADNIECPTKLDIVINGIGKPNEGYDFPWKFAIRKNFEEMLKFKYIGVYEHSIHCRTQYYEVKVKKSENPKIYNLSIDNQYRWFNKKEIKKGRYQLHVSSRWDKIYKPLNPHPEGSSCFFNKYPSLRIVPRKIKKGEEFKFIAMHWDIRDDELSYFNGTIPIMENSKPAMISANLENEDKIEETVELGNWCYHCESPVINNILIKFNRESNVITFKYKSKRKKPPKNNTQYMHSLENKLDMLLYVVSQFLINKCLNIQFIKKAVEETIRVIVNHINIVNNSIGNFNLLYESWISFSKENYEGAIKYLEKFLENNTTYSISSSIELLINFYKMFSNRGLDKITESDLINETKLIVTELKKDNSHKYDKSDDTIWRMRVYAFDKAGRPIRFFSTIVPEFFTQDDDDNNVFTYNISLKETSEVERMQSNGKWKQDNEKTSNIDLINTYLKNESTYLEKGTSIVFEGITGYVSTAEEVIFSD